MTDNHSRSESARIDALPDIIELITGKLNSGESIDVRQLIEDHPEHSNQLRELIPALEAMSLLAHHPANHETGKETSGDFADPSVAIGQLGEFHIIREIGRGGMGIVYEAEQQSLSRRVALKVFPFASLLDNRQLKRFRNEAQVAASLKHPNIVGVYSVGCELGVHYYAMELVEGQSLAQVLNSMRRAEAKRTTDREAQGPRHDLGNSADTTPAAKFTTELSDSRRDYYRSVARITMQLAEALHYAHGEGVIHRDVKPSNVMIDREEKPWITDFGLARIQANTELTASGELLGTLRYMSPEQAQGRSIVDERSDVYSLGATLHELLTLHPLFEQDDRAALIRAVVDEAPPAPRRCNRMIPVDLETIVLKATCKSPHDRYANCSQFAEDLRRFLDHKPIAARRASGAEHAWRWSRRNPHVAVLTLSVALLLLVLGIGGSVIATKQSRRAKQLKEELYDAQMGVAQAAMQNDEYDRADRILRAHVPRDGEADLRAFEWFHLWHECQRALGTTTFHSDWPVYSLSFSQDGQFFATAGYSGQISLRTAKSMEPIWQFENDYRRKWPRVTTIVAIAFSPDGTLLATGGRDSTLRLWSVATGEILFEKEAPSLFVSSLAFSPDGKTLAAGREQHEARSNDPTEIQLWSTATMVGQGGDDVETTILDANDEAIGRIHAVTFSLDGSYLAACSNSGRVHLWDGKTHQPLPAILVEGDVVSDVEFSPTDEEILCVVSGGTDTSRQATRTISLWNLEERKRIHRFWDQTSGAKEVAFSPNGKFLASGGYGRDVQLWDLTTHSLSRTFGRHSGVIHDVAFSPDGSSVATASTDNTVKLWRMNDPVRVDRFVGHDAGVLGLAVSQDSKTLVSAGLDATARLWDTKTGSQIQEFRMDVGELMGVAISPDGQTVAVGGGRYGQWSQRVEFALWDVRTGEKLHTLLSTIGKQLATSSIYSAAFSDSGHRVAALVGNSVKIWDAATGKLIHDLTATRGGAKRFAWSPNGKTVATVHGRRENGVKLWDATEGRLITTLESHADGHLAVAFSPDSRMLAVGGADSGIISLYDVEQRRHIRDLTRHTDKVFALDFSRDGRRLVSSSRASVKIWNLNTGRDILTFNDLTSVCWSTKLAPDGSALFATDMQMRDARIHVWRAASPEEALNQLAQPVEKRLLFEGRKSSGEEGLP